MAGPTAGTAPTAGADLAPAVDWVLATTPPATVVQRARLMLLDCLGCIASGLRHAEVQRIGASLATWFPGSVRLPGVASGLGPAGAAAVAAAAMLWDEANEGLASAHGRPALSVAPILVAQPYKTLSALLDALLLGYEVGGRAGEAWRIRPGMHVDGSFHSLGAAVAAARLIGADPHQAMRIAACQIPFSLYLPLARGMTGRNTYPAHAALLGVLSAAAAAAGTEAPADGFAEARRIALGHEDAAPMSPTGTWLILQAYFKPFAGVRHAHYAAAAAIALRQRVPETRAIRHLRLATYAEALQYAGRNRAPETAIAAQFSLSFGVASGLRFGDLGPEAYLSLDDPELRRLEALVELVEVKTLTDANRRGATLVAQTDAGTVESMADRVPGDPDNPLGEAAVGDKFKRLAGHLPGADRLIEAILRGPLDAPLPDWSGR